MGKLFSVGLIFMLSTNTLAKSAELDLAKKIQINKAFERELKLREPNSIYKSKLLTSVSDRDRFKLREVFAKWKKNGQPFTVIHYFDSSYLFLNGSAFLQFEVLSQKPLTVQLNGRQKIVLNGENISQGLNNYFKKNKSAFNFSLLPKVWADDSRPGELSLKDLLFLYTAQARADQMPPEPEVLSNYFKENMNPPVNYFGVNKSKQITKTKEWINEAFKSLGATDDVGSHGGYDTFSVKADTVICREGFASGREKINGVEYNYEYSEGVLKLEPSSELMGRDLNLGNKTKYEIKMEDLKREDVALYAKDIEGPNKDIDDLNSEVGTEKVQPSSNHEIIVEKALLDYSPSYSSVKEATFQGRNYFNVPEEISSTKPFTVKKWLRCSTDPPATKACENSGLSNCILSRITPPSGVRPLLRGYRFRDAVTRCYKHIGTPLPTRGEMLEEALEKMPLQGVKVEYCEDNTCRKANLNKLIGIPSQTIEQQIKFDLATKAVNDYMVRFQRVHVKDGVNKPIEISWDENTKEWVFANEHKTTLSGSVLKDYISKLGALKEEAESSREKLAAAKEFDKKAELISQLKITKHFIAIEGFARCCESDLCRVKMSEKDGPNLTPKKVTQ